MHRLPRTLLAVLAAAPVSLTACGGDDLGARSAPAVIKEAFGAGQAPSSGTLDLRVTLDLKGLPSLRGPVRLAIRGPFAAGPQGGLPRFRLGATVDAAGQGIAAGAVSTGDAAWITFAGAAFRVPRATVEQLRGTLRADRSAKAPGLRALGIDPARWLTAPRKAGEEDVGGARTVHVTSAVDVPAVLRDLDAVLARADASGASSAAGGRVPARLTAAQRAQLQAAITATSLDVYAGKEDGVLRRLNLQVRFAVPAAERAAAGGLSSGTLGLDLVLTDVGKEQEITAPRSDRPLAELTGGATARATPGADTASAPEARYRACLRAAGTRIAEVQKCAPLLEAP